MPSYILFYPNSGTNVQFNVTKHQLFWFERLNQIQENDWDDYLIMIKYISLVELSIEA